MLLFALAKKSGPEHMVGDSNNWVMVLLSDRELFTGKILSRIELLLLVYLKCAVPFSPPFQKAVFMLFQNVWNPPFTEPWKMFTARSLVQQLSESSSEARKKTQKPAFILRILFRMHFLTSPSPGQSSRPCWCLQGHLGMFSDPFSLLFLFSLLCYPPLNFQLNRNADGHMSF